MELKWVGALMVLAMFVGGTQPQTTTTLTTTTTTSTLYCPPFDLIFVLDSSGSLGTDNWNLVKQFAANVVDTLTIGENNTRLVILDGWESKQKKDIKE